MQNGAVHPYNHHAAVTDHYASAPPLPSDYFDAPQPYYYHQNQNQTPVNYNYSTPNPPNFSASSYSAGRYSIENGRKDESCCERRSESTVFDDHNQNQNQTPVSYDYNTPNHPSYSSSFYSSGRYSIENNGVSGDQGFYESGVYKYNGRKEESYGESRSESVVFDDYGRAINIPKGRENQGYESSSSSSTKVVRATPKMEEQHVLKFCVKLLSEGIGQSDMDVFCQIGLDGIRILDSATNRTLRIYLLENLTRWEVLDSYIFAFWAKSTIDVEPRRIRLKSNSYTVNNILDTVTAASIQIKEMGESSKPSDSIKGSDQAAEKKNGFPDLMKLLKPLNEEKDFWVPDEAVHKCTACRMDFSAFNRKHHCRNCGDIFCDKCTQGRVTLTADEDAQPVRVCDRCMAEVTQRLSNATDGMTKVSTLRSHEDLTRKLKEEMDKKRKTSAGHSLQGSTGMREVECPTCTVHLQVEVPGSGSEKIECSVCQHPFLVSAN